MAQAQRNSGGMQRADTSKTVEQMLVKYKDQIAAALPKHLTPERLSRIALTEVRKSKHLRTANPVSMIGAIVAAAQLGLEPGILGHCYLVPFKGDVQLIIGYRGMIDLARRSGQTVSISAHVVYEGDQFEYRFGLDENLTHIPCAVAKRGDRTHVYAVAKLVGGGYQIHVMEWAEVEAVRDTSEGYMAFKAGKIRSNPWETHLDEMACKTAVRRLFKFLPVSVEIQRAVVLDERADLGMHQNNAAIIDTEFMVLDDDDEDAPDAVTLKGQIKRTDEKPAATTAPPLDLFMARINSATDADGLDLLRGEAKEAFDDAGMAKIDEAIKARIATFDVA